MNLKQYLLALIGAFFFLGDSYAQTSSKPISVQSPNAASLGVYGQIPVSLFNGLAQISIPIGSVSQDGVDVEVKLGYHGGGVRPDDHPGWVGQGFDLQAGGVISRRVNGGTDEVLDGSTSQKTHFSYYDNYSNASGDNWYSDLGKYVSVGQIPAALPSPDEFVFNFGKYSGSFFYDHTGKWQVRSTDPVHLEIKGSLLENFSLAGQYPTSITNKTVNIGRIFYQFIITTPDGAQYFFGGTDSSIEFTRAINGGNPSDDPYNSSIIPNSWYLTKIVTKNGNEIKFEYERDGIFPQVYPSFYFQNAEVTGSSYDSKTPKQNFSSNISIINPCYLIGINSTNQAVRFVRSISHELNYNFSLSKDDPILTMSQMERRYPDLFWPQSQGSQPPTSGTPVPGISNLYFKWVKLDGIQFLAKDNPADDPSKFHLLKEFKFSYTDIATSRLMLESLTETSNNTNKPPYKFTYSQVALPGYLSGMTDHWGFYNGRNFFTEHPLSYPSKLYYTNDDVPTFVDSKAPNIQLMQAGSLIRIKYPTGGYTDFDYEPHDYSMVASKYPFKITNTTDHTIAGGLRIKKITDFDADGSTLQSKEYLYVKNYSSVNPGTSSGILSGIPEYVDQGVLPGNPLTVKFWNWSGNPIVPLSKTNGNDVTYSEVVEKRSDGSFEKNLFSNHDTPKYLDRASVYGLYSAVADKQWFLDPNISMALDRGKLLKKQYFNNKSIPVKEIEYAYDEGTAREQEAVRIINLTQRSYDVIVQSAAGGPKTYYLNDNRFTSYLIYTFPQYLLKETQTDYNQNGQNPVTLIRNHKYNTLYRQLASDSSLMSDSIPVLRQFSYPYDMVASGKDPNNIYKTMVSKNIIAPVIEQSESKNNKRTSFIRTNYDKFNANNLFLPKSVEEQLASFPIETKQLFNKYDLKGNLLEQQRYGGIKESYLWGYQEQYPTAIVKNATRTPDRDSVYRQTTPVYGSFDLKQNVQDYTATFDADAGSLNLFLGCNPLQALYVEYQITGPSLSNGGTLLLIKTDKAPLEITRFRNSYTYNAVVNLPFNGKYTITLRLPSNASYSDDNQFSAYFSYSGSKTTEQVVTIVGLKEYFYQGFEAEINEATTTPYAGLKYHVGPYQIPYQKPNSRAYQVDYRYLDAGTWKYAVKDFEDNMVLSDGSAIDEVRVYPKDAQISTYTYIPLVGLNSNTDSKGQTTFYKYDEFQRLKNVKDQNGNIIKNTTYNYKP